jgi:hypothetical protein
MGRRRSGVGHIHVHSHVNETVPHRASAHLHPNGFRWRALVVGLMHGMAGSAALLVLAISPAANRGRRNGLRAGDFVPV